MNQGPRGGVAADEVFADFAFDRAVQSQLEVTASAEMRSARERSGRRTHLMMALRGVRTVRKASVLRAARRICSKDEPS